MPIDSEDLNEARSTGMVSIPKEISNIVIVFNMETCFLQLYNGYVNNLTVYADPDTPALRARAEALGSKLGIPILGPGDYPQGLALTVTEARLELRQFDSRPMGPVYADFLEGHSRHRHDCGLSRQLLVRAVGYKGKPLTICDATAGLGRDAFLLACAGCSVTAIERSPVMAAILVDGIERATVDPAIGPILRDHLHFIEGDSRSILPRLAATSLPDVTYIDSMFPPRAKTALAKKEMRICRLAVGNDHDADELFRIALSHTRRRIVVKRWLRVPPLAERPNIVFKGKTIRYDVYLIAQ